MVAPIQARTPDTREPRREGLDASTRQRIQVETLKLIAALDILEHGILRRTEGSVSHRTSSLVLIRGAFGILVKMPMSPDPEGHVAFRRDVGKERFDFMHFARWPYLGSALHAWPESSRLSRSYKR